MPSPPFERYPGPPAGGGDVYRVISPWRDSLAWVSAAGRLSLVRFLVREGGGWRTVVDSQGEAGAEGGIGWSLVHRDPVEVVLEARLPGGETIRAAVTVSREGCMVRLTPALAAPDLDDMVTAGEWLHITAG